MADYNYQPVYGVEPWQNIAEVPTPAVYGGGARVTGQNLIISMWSMVGGLPSQLLVPVTETAAAAALDATTPGFGTKALLPAFNSRTSARFGILLDDAVLAFPVLAIINPPNDLKTQLANAMKANIDSDIGVEYLKSVLGPGAFEVYYTNGNNAALPGSAVPSNITGYTFFATNGANGVAPVALPLVNVQPGNVNTLIPALNRGDFYIGMKISLTDDNFSGVITINWPHSAARG